MSWNSERECLSPGRRYLTFKICKLGQNWGYTPCSRTMASNRYKITSYCDGHVASNKRILPILFQLMSFMSYVAIMMLLLLCCINLWTWVYTTTISVAQLSVSLSRSVYFFSFHNSFHANPLASSQNITDHTDTNKINIDLRISAWISVASSEQLSMFYQADIVQWNIITFCRVITKLLLLKGSLKSCLRQYRYASQLD